jgi:hypothetical protein
MAARLFAHLMSAAGSSAVPWSGKRQVVSFGRISLIQKDHGSYSDNSFNSRRRQAATCIPMRIELNDPGSNFPGTPAQPITIERKPFRSPGKGCGLPIGALSGNLWIPPLAGNVLALFLNAGEDSTRGARKNEPVHSRFPLHHSLRFFHLASAALRAIASRCFLGISILHLLIDPPRLKSLSTFSSPTMATSSGVIPHSSAISRARRLNASDCSSVLKIGPVSCGFLLRFLCFPDTQRRVSRDRFLSFFHDAT